MVVADDRQQIVRRAERPGDLLADQDVLAHQGALLLIEGPLLLEDVVGNADLPDVVDDPAPEQVVEHLFLEPDRLAQAPGAHPHPLGVGFRQAVLRLDSSGQREDRPLRVVEAVVEVLHPQQRADPGDQLDPLDRLDDEVVRTNLQAADAVGDLAESGDHDDRQQLALRRLLQALADLVAVHPRHHHVQQHQVRRFLVDLLQRFDAVGGSDDAAVDVRQAAFDQLQVQRVVVDDQHHRLSPGLSHG